MNCRVLYHKSPIDKHMMDEMPAILKESMEVGAGRMQGLQHTPTEKADLIQGQQVILQVTGGE